NSNKTNLGTDLFDTKSNFTTALTATGAGNDIQFTINGASFSFNSRTTSLNTIMSAVNNNSTANVVMAYDELSDKITISSRQLGSTSQVAISDTTGNLLTGALGLSVNKAGVDASMSYDDGSGAKTITRATNSFSINGIAYTLKEDNAGPVNLNISGDTSKIHDMIKGFIDQYNSLIDKVNTKYTEKRDRSYVPLTDDQKSQMKDADITNWETKAKQGLLHGDSLLSNITDSMRSALSDVMYQDSTNSTKLSVTLASIGITTSSDYTQRGKLVIDDDKLNDAISKNPDQIVQLFSKDDSGVSYNDGLNDPTKRKQRYDESGLAVRLYDIIQDNIRTTRDNNGKKGVLLEKAGKAGDVTEYLNTLTSQMNDYDTKIMDENDLITTKSNALYTKYSNLETMLNNMNSQGSWLSAQTSKM
ncbi:MAG TPA: flagellar filament capping protein FliD, partial [Clostridia bacterium]